MGVNLPYIERELEAIKNDIETLEREGFKL